MALGPVLSLLDPGSLETTLRAAAAFVVVLGILVFVHESGHYLAARWRGVHVEVFSIGFGRALATWTDRVGTRWRIGWLPLGGYVKLHGQERPEHAPAHVRAAWRPGRTFHEKGVGSRAIVVAAGPAANFLLAFGLLACLFASFGFPVPTNTVGALLPGGAAARAGLRVGDRIEAIGGQPVATFEEVRRLVAAHPGETLDFKVARPAPASPPGAQPGAGSDAGSGAAPAATLTIPVTLGASGGGAHRTGLLGIGAGNAVLERLSPGRALEASAQQCWSVTTQTLSGLWEMVYLHRGADDLGGPLRIAALSGQVSQMGLGSLLEFIALLSINLGLINLFPVPMLDGGHLVFYAIEALRGRPVPMRTQEVCFRIGFGLLVCLFVFTTWNDLLHLGAVRWVETLLGFKAPAPARP